jgi:hypothetical protein
MFVVIAVLVAAAQPTTKGWTFCIAEAGDDIFVTEVFRATLEREKLETVYAAKLRTQGVPRADVQCPAPLGEKTDAINAQFVAIEFQRKLSHHLHVEPPPPLKP